MHNTVSARQYWWGYLLVVLIAALPLFAHIDELPVMLFDEQRLATNAFEMKQSGNLLLTTYDGEPDYWNTKPPLMIWLQALSMNAVGTNELALRIPSALAALATCLLLYRFCAIRLRRPMLGVLSVLILCTTKGYVDIHGTRTGDYDALLTLFTTAYVLSWFAFLEDGRPKQLYGFYAFLALAILTKCTASCLMLPALLFYTIWRKRFMATITNRHFYLGLLLVVVPVGLWYTARQHVDPGYLAAVWQMDIVGRYKEAMGFKLGPSYYLLVLAGGSYMLWLALGISAPFVARFSKEEQLGRLCAYLLFVAAFFVCILSLSATKFYWYLLPAYPLFALLAGVTIYIIGQLFSTSISLRGKLLIQLAMVFLVFASPYCLAIDRSFNTRLDESMQENLQMGYFMKDLLHGDRQLGRSAIVIEGYEGNIRWYIKVLRAKGVRLITIEDRKLMSGQQVIAFQYELKQYIESNFETTLMEDFRGVHTYQIIRAKTL